MQRRTGLLFVLLLMAAAACSPASPATEFAETAVARDSGELPTAESGSITQTEITLSPDPFIDQRQAMVQSGIIDWGIKDEAVIQAMGTVPRHLFVTDMYQDQAYANHPLPIGFGQTISQPYIVALMTEAATVGSGDTVLEIGTGSGYQAAVLAEIVDQVNTIEIVGALAERARSDLARAGYDNVEVRHADGYFGWEELAPFDAIVVTAAPDHIPQPLLQQLKIGGHMIIPVGPVGGVQTLWRVTRVSEDEVRNENLGGVRFVPFTREERQE
jgi:protein-L-isoaspartate(D-aspartate) O-methyltransferase